MRLALLAILAAPLPAQLVTYFVPGTATIGPYTAIGVNVCNGGGVAQTQTAAELQREAAGQGIMLASNAQLLAAAKTIEHRSLTRNILLGTEIGLGIFTSLMAADVIEIKERVRAVIPIAAAGIRIGTTAFKAEPTEIPPTRPTVVQIAAGACEEQTVYGKVRGK